MYDVLHIFRLSCAHLGNIARRVRQPEVVIRRSKPIKSHPRGHISEDIVEDHQPNGRGQTPPSLIESVSVVSSGTVATLEEPPDDLQRIRALLYPPPIPGVANWGIPEPSTEPCNPAIEVCILPPFLHHSKMTEGPISRPNLRNSTFSSGTPLIPSTSMTP